MAKLIWTNQNPCVIKIFWINLIWIDLYLHHHFLCNIATCYGTYNVINFINGKLLLIFWVGLRSSSGPIFAAPVIANTSAAARVNTINVRGPRHILYHEEGLIKENNLWIWYFSGINISSMINQHFQDILSMFTIAI